MKKLLWFIIVMLTTAGLCYGDEFQPSLLKLGHEEVVLYDFDSSELNIPIMVNGTNAGFFLAIFTHGRADEIELTTNGHLGWHTVNKIDTCIYYSDLYSVQQGENHLDWDGRDQDGNTVPAGTYTYYVWAFDNQSDKLPATEQLHIGESFDRLSSIREIDGNGLPLANPVISQYYNDPDDGSDYLLRWMIGSDPEDSTRLLKNVIETQDGWRIIGNPLADPNDSDCYFLPVIREDHSWSSIQKVKLTDNGSTEIDPFWGETPPYAYTINREVAAVSSIATDGTFLYSTSCGDTEISNPRSSLNIFTLDGDLVETVNISDWWNSEYDYDKGGQMNGGPEMMVCRNGLLFLNSHGSCLNQMLDPARYLSTGNKQELSAWTNGNGDYTLDKNWEQTSARKWVCNDNTVGPYKWSISADSRLFSAVNSYDIGTTSFGLFAPDGTGLGFYTYQNDTAGKKYTSLIVDSGTAYDGFYHDGEKIGTYANYTDPNAWNPTTDLLYVAHDVVRGFITYPGGELSRNLELRYPQGGEVFRDTNVCTIQWSADFIDAIDIEVSYDNGAVWTGIRSNIPAENGRFNWNIPEIYSEQCLIRIHSSSYMAIQSVNSMPFTISSDVAVTDAAPHSFSLSQNSPNPFNPVTTIDFSIPAVSHVTLSVYSISGQKVATLVDGLMSAGKHIAVFDGSSLASGMYFYRLEAGGMVKSGKMILMK